MPKRQVHFLVWWLVAFTLKTIDRRRFMHRTPFLLLLFSLTFTYLPIIRTHSCHIGRYYRRCLFINAYIMMMVVLVPNMDGSVSWLPFFLIYLKYIRTLIYIRCYIVHYHCIVCSSRGTLHTSSQRLWRAFNFNVFICDADIYF